jgi:hypothetical protein
MFHVLFFQLDWRVFYLGASSDSKMWLTDWNKGEGKASGQRKVTAFFPPTDNFTNGKCHL